MKNPKRQKIGSQVESKQPEGVRGSPTVLHIDDDPNDTLLLEAARQKAAVDFELRNVGDGEAAIAYLSDSQGCSNRDHCRQPVLVLLDLKMPRATGFEILKWIRTHPTLAELPVVVLSGSELQADIRHAYAAGANFYLVKPVSFDRLVGLVKRIYLDWVVTSRV